MIAKILGAQRDFSYGEVDVSLKRADDHPARKAGLRQMSNARILNSGAIQVRSGRRAIYPISSSTKRIERFAMKPGKEFDIAFTPGNVTIVDPSTGASVGAFTNQGNGAALPWVTDADIDSIVYAFLNFSIYICFGNSMRPQVVTWDGVSTWSIADYNELLVGNQKRTLFYRISPQGITMFPSGRVGAITLTASQALFTAAWVGTRIRFVGRQVLITGYTSPTVVSATVQESLPGRQALTFGTDPATAYSVGDEVIGITSGAKGLIVNVDSGAGTITVQLLSAPVASVPGPTVTGFLANEAVVGPGGGYTTSDADAVNNPAPVTVWDDEVMNDFRGYPASCFVDQFRLGFCNFSSVTGGISWSAINAPTDQYTGPNPSDAMFELAPRKVQVYYVIAGPEGSEFVVCDRALYYIPISVTNPLKPGSVSFQLLSSDGCAQVQPRVSQEALLYINAGQNSVMAVLATGAYTRPFNTKNLTELHAHLFNGILAIAAPSADGTFNERYVYILNGDKSITVGKYDADTLQDKTPVIGWGPWSGAGIVTWVSAYAADVSFTSTYGNGTGVCEVLDDTFYLDCGLPVNAAPAPFAPPVGKGPLWFMAGLTVSLMDQGTRSMGTYQVDANGYIVPQFKKGEDLTRLDLVAGQQWTMNVEPFCPDAPPGNDVGQRNLRRRVARFSAHVVHSTGFVMGRLFSGPTTPTSPPLGTLMNARRFPAWNFGDDPTQPPPQRETAERIRPLGRSYDPRVVVIKDTPGPLLIAELDIEATI
ncbi:hypothetical protein ABIB99_001909 [Bradyrhizobium sp. LA6.1]|uniref:hypothetical protein n=1 Tax=Bradyrhizobium sp. LA6.1 TaxID=3156378 RepID=UPI0033930541